MLAARRPRSQLLAPRRPQAFARQLPLFNFTASGAATIHFRNPCSDRPTPSPVKRSSQTVAALALLSLALACGDSASLMQAAEKGKAPARPRLPFTASVQVGDTHYLSGWGSRDPKLGRHPDGFEAQVHQLMINLKGLLQRNGLGFGNVVHTHCYMTYTDRFEDFYRIYRGYFSGPLPALTTVGVPRLPATEVEITFIATERASFEVIRPAGASPGPHFSHGVKDGEFLYTSGESGRNLRTGRLPEGDFSQHARQSLTNLGAVLQAAGLGFRDVVKVEVYLADIGLEEKFNAIYRSFFPQDPPTLTTVGVTELPKGTQLVVNLVAAHGKKVVRPAGIRTRPEASPAIRVGDRLFLSGSVGTASGDTATQVRQAMNELGRVLQGAGMNFSNVVKGKVYLTDMNDYAAMNEAYGSYFSVLFPARSCIQMGTLPGNAKVKITLIADASPRR